MKRASARDLQSARSDAPTPNSANGRPRSVEVAPRAATLANRASGRRPAAGCIVLKMLPPPITMASTLAAARATASGRLVRTGSHPKAAASAASWVVTVRCHSGNAPTKARRRASSPRFPWPNAPAKRAVGMGHLLVQSDVTAGHGIPPTTDRQGAGRARQLLSPRRVPGRAPADVQPRPPAPPSSAGSAARRRTPRVLLSTGRACRIRVPTRGGRWSRRPLDTAGGGGRPPRRVRELAHRGHSR